MSITNVWLNPSLTSPDSFDIKKRKPVEFDRFSPVRLNVEKGSKPSMFIVRFKTPEEFPVMFISTSSSRKSKPTKSIISPVLLLKLVISVLLRLFTVSFAKTVILYLPRRLWVIDWL